MALYRRALPAVALTGVVSLVLASCGGGDSDNGGTAGGDTDCADYEQYGDLTGKEVTVFTGIVTPEDALLEATWVPFEECTGVDIVGTFDKSFETQILVQARAGNPPDIAIVPQPGLLKQLVDTGKAVAASEETSAMVDENFSEDWKAYGTIDGTFYAPPQNSNVKSFVW
ncbi:MAG: carbohydrate ABC transporter substrate-binding protein, partial [Frankiales bacterium]